VATLSLKSKGSLSNRGKSPAATSSAGAGGGKSSAKERMVELNELLEAGLVSQGEFDAKRSEILASL
jgi:hypothetical protein